MKYDFRCEFCGAKLIVLPNGMVSDCDCPLYPYITGKQAETEERKDHKDG